MLTLICSLLRTEGVVPAKLFTFTTDFLVLVVTLDGVNTDILGGLVEFVLVCKAKRSLPLVLTVKYLNLFRVSFLLLL